MQSFPNIYVSKPIYSNSSEVGQSGNAVFLTAGAGNNAGNVSGGNIIFTDTGAINLTNGGRALLFSGSISGSTGLTNIVGSGSGHFRYNSDSGHLNFGATIPLEGGIYGIYREQPSIVVKADDKTLTYGSFTPSNFTYTLSGALVNGDSANLYVSYSSESQPVLSSSYNTVVGNYTLLPYSPYLQSLGYNVTLNSGSLQVVPKPLLISGLNGVSKVYDGNANAAVDVTNASKTGLVETPLEVGVARDVVNFTATGLFDNKNVGTNKTISLTGAYSGADAGNYIITLQPTTSANISQLPSVIWTGAGGNNNWSNAANWYAGALPDANNVASVIIPSSASVIFDSAAALTNLATLTAYQGASFTMAGSSLGVYNALTTPTYIQSGGTLSGSGSLNVTESFSKTGGLIGMSGPVSITQLTGDLAFENGLPLTFGNIRAFNGNINIETTGGLITTELIKSDLGGIFLTTHSPMTIGGQGLDASTGISLQASTPGSDSTITFNAPLTSTSGTVNMTAFGNIAQNADITAPGVSVSSTSGNIVIANNAVTTAYSISYAAPSGMISYSPANFSGATPIILDFSNSVASDIAETASKIQEEKPKETTSSSSSDNGGVSMRNFPTMLFDSESSSVPPKLIVEASKSLPSRAGVLNRDEVKVMLEQMHEARTALFGEALATLALNPQAADVADCGTGGSGLCIAKAVTVPGQKTYSPEVKRKIALLIGNNTYRSPIPDLETAIGDVSAISEQLRDQFGYEIKVVENADRKKIVEALNELILSVDRDDSVLVMYAGHGYLDNQTGAGYWIPTDASPTSPDKWISNNSIARALGNIPAKQVMLVSDSCYSGSLTKEGKQTETVAIKREQMLMRRSVLALSSGGEEPVSDEGQDNHSIFAWNMIQTLKNMSNETAGKSLHATIKASVMKDFPQEPQYGTVISAGHAEGGEYLLTPKRAIR